MAEVKRDPVRCYRRGCGWMPTAVAPVLGNPQAFCRRHLRARTHPILSAEVLEGTPADWAKDTPGESTPQVTSCPFCGVRHWREGELVRCAAPDCEAEWRPDAPT